jgi:hypothetical protein
VDQILAWPEMKFKALFEAFSRRKIAEEITTRKIAMIAAHFANSAFMETEQGMEELRKRIETYETFAQEAIDRLYGAKPVRPKNEDPYGFFEAGRRSLKQRGMIAD